jgi:hypothetical protein
MWAHVTHAVVGAGAFTCLHVYTLTCVAQVAHAAVALMDATMMGGVHMTDKFETLFIVACLRIAASNEGSYVPTPEALDDMADYPGSRRTLSPN